MAKTVGIYNVVTHYSSNPDLARIEKGYTILIKIAIRMIEEKKLQEINKND